MGYQNQQVAVVVATLVTPADPAQFLISSHSGLPIYGAPVVVGRDESNNPIYGPGYSMVIPGDASIERAAPASYLNTLLDARSHVDTSMVYLSSMNDGQFAQLGSYVDTVIGSGGLSSYKQNEALAGAWMGLQGSPAAMGRIGEGLSIVGLGLRNVASALGESLGRMAMGEGAVANSTLGRALFAGAKPMYAVPPGRSVTATTPDGVVYRRIDRNGTVEPYGGQAINEARYLQRQTEHARAYPDADFEFTIMNRANPGSQLDIAEHNYIQSLTGGVVARDSSIVSNQKDPVGRARRIDFGLPEPKRLK